MESFRALKRILKLDGARATLAMIVVSFGAMAAYLAQAHLFSVLALIIYGLIVFGEASGLNQVLKKQA